jgi:hypothetical protein
MLGMDWKADGRTDIMTEAEWLACTDPHQMVRFLKYGKGSDRQLRLFGCACCRQVWDLLTEECFRDAVEIAEQFADGQVGSSELAEARGVCEASLDRKKLASVMDPRDRTFVAAFSCTRNPRAAARGPLGVFTDETQRRWELQLLRDIFGNPFRPVSVDPFWLTPSVVAVARTIYEDRRFEDMPILADALEEAGCNDADILGHCRGPGPHVRGCWTVDLLLGKE